MGNTEIKLSLWDKIQKSENPLATKNKESKSSCIYPNPFKGHSEVVCWFYCRNTRCEVFFACSKKVADEMFRFSYAEVNDNFTVYIEHEVMTYCIENTDWCPCFRYMVDYNENARERNEKGQFTGRIDNGCEGSVCHCEPFGQGDWTYGTADIEEFDLDMDKHLLLHATH